jgi:hypothetical protein
MLVFFEIFFLFLDLYIIYLCLYFGHVKKSLFQIYLKNAYTEKWCSGTFLFLANINQKRTVKNHIEDEEKIDLAPLKLEGTCSHTLGYMKIIILSFFCHLLLSFFFCPVICPCHFSVIFVVVFCFGRVPCSCYFFIFFLSFFYHFPIIFYNFLMIFFNCSNFF